MRVYISIDIEGVAGIVHGDQCRRGRHGYDQACVLMTAEANAAALGAFEGGAEHVLINDSHGDMRNLVLEALDKRVEVITGALKPFSMAQGLAGGHYDVALFVGYHGGMGTAGAILDHTYRSTVVSEVRVNARPFNEAALNALVAGAAGTPLGLVTGDESTCLQCADLFGDQLETVIVKWAIGRLAARSLHPAEACRRIRAAAREVVRGCEGLEPFRVEPPYVLDLDVLNTAIADVGGIMPRVERTGPRTLRYVADDVDTLFRAMLAMVKLGGTVV